MRFADSFTQDMDFWRQRVAREETCRVKPSAFAGDALDSLPHNPYKDSGGMLLGAGVSPRHEPTPLGVHAPMLAAYRAAITPTMQKTAVVPNTWHLSATTTAPYLIGGLIMLLPLLRMAPSIRSLGFRSGFGCGLST